MGYVYKETLERAVPFVFNRLKTTCSFCFSEIYDGSDETWQSVLEEMGITEVDDAHCPALLRVDLIVAEMEEAGLVMTEQLSRKLPDGEDDYRITITEEGQEFIKSGKTFKCRDIVL